MIYSKFKDKELSMLGFGAMRLPTKDDGSVDEDRVREMVAYAMDQGVNYFDTAYSYHDGESELVMGRILSAYPRDSYYLATKFPGHQIFASGYKPGPIFEEQLKKCGVDYFDFYLLHNVYEKSIGTYLDPQWQIVDYFKEQVSLGRIKHLGFSSHAGIACLKEFLDLHGDAMEFCLMQVNYVDWTLQNAKNKYELMEERGIPLWVMEPVRGGKLARLRDFEEEKLKALRPDESVASWAFRFLQNLPNVKVVLSGMTKLDQVKDNVKTFSGGRSLSQEEVDLLLDLAEGMKASIPCTDCRYCCESCPQALDIPFLIGIYNELCFAKNINTSMRVEGMPEDKQPSACIACGKCTQVCPQNIDIPTVMEDLVEVLKTMPRWEDISRHREAVAEKYRPE